MNIIKSFITNVLNIKPDEKQRWLLLSTLITGLMLTYTGPIIHKTMIMDLPAEWLSISAIIDCISGLFVGMIWKGKVRSSLIKYFAVFCITECIAGFILGCYLAFVNYNSWVFAIATTIYTSLITIFVCKIIMAFKAKIWTETEREIYDNNLSITMNIVCLLGYAVSLIHMPTITTACFIWGTCCLLDDAGWIIVYFKYIKGKITLDEI